MGNKIIIGDSGDDLNEKEMKDILEALGNHLYSLKNATFPNKRDIGRVRKLGKKLNFLYGLMTGFEIRIE